MTWLLLSLILAITPVDTYCASYATCSMHYRQGNWVETISNYDECYCVYQHEWQDRVHTFLKDC